MYSMESLTSVCEKMRILETELNILKSQQRTPVNQNLGNNLVFLGVTENDFIPEEQAIRNIIRNMKSLPTKMYQNLSFQNVYRIGAYSESKGRPRPILAIFASYKDREAIRKASSDLKHTNVSIREHFSSEILKRRRALIPLLREARLKNRYSVLRGDILQIDSEVWQVDEQGHPVLHHRMGIALKSSKTYFVIPMSHRAYYTQT